MQTATISYQALRFSRAIALYAITISMVLITAPMHDAAAVKSFSMDSITLLWSSKEEHNAMTIGICWSPDGKYVACSFYDAAVVIWDAVSAVPVKKLRIPGPRIDSGVEPVDLLTHTNKFETVTYGFPYKPSIDCDWPEEGDNASYLPVRCVAWSPDGQYLAAGSDDTNVTIFDTKDWSLWKILSEHEGSVLTVDWSPDGKYIASGSGTDNIDPHNTETPENMIKIWDVAAGKRIANLTGHKDSVQCVRWSPDGKHIASASDNMDKTVKLWNAADPNNATNVLNMTGHTLGTLCVGWSPDGKTIVSGSRDFTIRFWYSYNGTQFKMFRANNCIRSVSYHPSGKYIAASGPAESMMSVWNVSSGAKREFTESEAARSTVYNCAWSKDGMKIAASSGREHIIRVYGITDTEVAGQGQTPPWLPGTLLFLAVSISVSAAVLYFGKIKRIATWRRRTR